MQAPEFVALLLRPLEATGIEYMVTGGLAAIIYGEPRLTNDVDVVLAMGPQDAERILEAFPAPAYYVPPREVLVEEASRAVHGHFNLLHLDSALRADVYIAGDESLAKWGLDHRRRLPIGADNVSVAPIEYVILLKLRYAREGGSDRHLRDIATMIRISADLIDDHALAEWIAQLGLESTWSRVPSGRESS